MYSFVLKLNPYKDENILNFEFQILGNTQHTVEIRDTTPTILIQTKPL